MTENSDHTAAVAGRRPFNLALGIERFGLLPLRAPIPALIIFALIALAAGFGVTRLKVDDSLSQLFRSDTPEFRQYEEVTRRFPSAEFDVLITPDQTVTFQGELKRIQ